MKKIIFSLFTLATVLGFTSCSETWDDAPKMETHEGVKTAHFLNEPAMQNQYLMISLDNREGYFHLTCSQPEYGYAAIVTYKVQVSLTEDFAEYEEITQAFYNCANINPVNSDVAACMEKLSGVTTEADLPLDYQPVYMRLRAYIEQAEEGTTYLSNVVRFDNIGVDYLAIWVEGVPANIYLRGGWSWDDSWGALSDLQFVTGPLENTWVIPHDITIEAGNEFKVADSTWGPLNLGAGDSNEVVPGTPFALSGGDNPGNLTVTSDFTGRVQLSLEAGTYYLTLESAQ